MRRLGIKLSRYDNHLYTKLLFYFFNSFQIFSLAISSQIKSSDRIFNQMMKFKNYLCLDL